MKRVKTAFLSAIIIASMISFPIFGNGLGPSNNRLTPPRVKVFGKSLDILKKIPAGHAIFFVSVVLTVSIIKMECEEARLSGRPMSSVQISKRIVELVPQIIGSPEFIFGISAMSGTGILLKKQMAQMAPMLSNKIAKKTLGTLVTRAASSLICSGILFGVWHLFDQLVQDARYNMKSAEDFEKSKNMISLLNGILNPINKEIRRESFRVLFELLTNMQIILKKDTANLLYNTFRFQIFTGDFMAMVVLMTSAGQLSASLSGGNLFVSVLAVIATAVACAFLPREKLDWITENVMIKSRRVKELNVIRTNDSRIEEIINYYKGGRFSYGENNRIVQLNNAFKRRSRVRERIVDTYLEVFYNTYLKITVELENLKFLEKNPDETFKTEKRIEVLDKIKDYQEKLHSIITEVASFYFNEREKIIGFLDELNLRNVHRSDRNSLNSYEKILLEINPNTKGLDFLARKLEQTIKILSKITKLLISVKEISSNPQADDEILKYIQLFYHDGLKEDFLL